MRVHAPPALLRGRTRTKGIIRQVEDVERSEEQFAELTGDEVVALAGRLLEPLTDR